MEKTVEKEGVIFIYHTFGPGETIRAIIRKYNHQNMKETLLQQLLEKYNQLNGTQVPRLGERVKIPLFLGFIGMPQHKRGYEND